MNEGGNGSRNTPRKEVQVVGYPMRGLLLLVLGVGGVTMLLSGLGVTLFADYEAWHVALAILLLLATTDTTWPGSFLSGLWRSAWGKAA